MSTVVLYHTRKETKTRLKLSLHMIWAVRRDNLVVDTTPLSGMPSSLMGEARVSLEWSSIPRPSGIMMLWKIEDNKHKEMSSQRTLREAQKLWRLLQF